MGLSECDGDGDGDGNGSKIMITEKEAKKILHFLRFF